MKKILILIIALSFNSANQAYAFDTKAKNAVAYEHITGDIIFAKDIDKSIPPASMSKLMTVYILFEQLRDGNLTLDDTFSVSEKAWKKGGSKMFVKVNDEVKIIDLIQGIIVQSGNDACIVVAEGLQGTEDDFAELMNEKAEELGLKDSTFANSTGWPDPNHRMSIRDILTLAIKIIDKYPEYYPYFGQKEFTYNKITQKNRNGLIGKNGIDGLKTGHTNEAGYGLVASAKEGDRRVTAIVSGLNSARAREMEAERLIRHVMKSFINATVAEKEKSLGYAKTWYGSEAVVSVVAKDDILATIPKYKKKKVHIKLSYHEPIFAPIKKGDEIGNLIISIPDRKDKIVPLYAGHDVNEISWFGKKMSDIKYRLSNLF